MSILSVTLAAVMAVSGPAFSLTVSPAKTVAQDGKPTIVRVTNYGSQPTAITVSLAEIGRTKSNAICHMLPNKIRWATVTPTGFTLSPKHSRTVSVSITGNTTPGTHDLAVRFLSPRGTVGTVRVMAGVDSQIATVMPGQVPKDAPDPCITFAAPKPASHTPIWPIALAAILVALAMVLALTYRAGRRHPKHANH